MSSGSRGRGFCRKKGTAIGSKMGKNYACTYMGEWEEEVKRKAREAMGKVPRLWLRFVDDIFGIWKGSKEEFQRLVDICNENEERIKVTYEVCEREAIFLDVKVTRKEDGEWKTELYIKPTDRTRYLHKESDHPRHVKEGIAKGQMRRLRRICSEEEDYWRYSKVVERKLVSQGYGVNAVRRQIREGSKMDRKVALERVEARRDDRVNFVTTHSAYLPNVNNILKRHGGYLKENGLEEFIGEVPRLSLRKGRNIGDLVVNAKAKKEIGGTGPCGRGCKLCGLMKKAEKVMDKDGKEMVIVGKMDCRTVGAVYGMWCDKCGKVVYVGKTMNRVMDRFNGHRADLRGGDESKPVHHFKKNGHVEGDMKVVVLEHVAGDDDVYRVTRERWWMNRMGTFAGENKKR